MSDFFGKIVAKISTLAGFPLMVYEADSQTMMRYSDSAAETISVPPSITPYLGNDSDFFHSQNVGDKILYLYFLRCVFDGKKYVFVINDAPSRVKLGRFFLAFSAVVREICANRDALTERIKILKNTLDNQSHDKDEIHRELQQLQAQIVDLEKIRDEALQNLKTQIEENAQLKMSSLDVAEAVKRLETSVRTKDAEIDSLRGQVAKTKEYEERIAQTVKVRNEAVERLKVLMGENTRLADDARVAKEEVIRLESSLATKNLDIDRLQNDFNLRVSEFENKLAQTIKVRNEAVIRIKTLTAENENLKMSSTAMDETVNNLKRAVTEREAEIQNIQKTYQAETADYQLKIEQLIKVRNEAVQRIKALMVENSSIKETLAALEGELKRYEVVVKEKEAELEELSKIKRNVNEYETRITQLLKVRNEAVIRIKAMADENRRLTETSTGYEAEMRRLEVAIMEKNQTLAEMHTKMEELVHSTVPIAEYENKMAQMIKIRNEAISRLKVQMEENEKLKEFSSGAREIVQNLEKTIHKQDEELREKNEVIKVKDAKMAKTRFYLNEMTELVKVVKKSRDKIMTLTDYITVPMYSVSSDRALVHANNALAQYVHASNVAKIVGKSCHKLVFGFDEPCPWCQLEKVQATGTGTTMGVMVNENGKRKNMELTIFPILDSTGTLIDCGEFLVDKTDTFELAQSLKRFKEQVTNFKRAKISGMNEIKDVKKAYDELSANYDLVVARNTKLTQALESLLVQDNNKEILNAKTETAEYKAALHRANGTINNYKKNLEDLQEKYVTLNRRAMFQVERLINIVKTKQSVDVDELSKVLGSMGMNFSEIEKKPSEE